MLSGCWCICQSCSDSLSVEHECLMRIDSKTYCVFNKITQCSVILWRSYFLLLQLVMVVVVTMAEGTWSAALCGLFYLAAETLFLEPSQTLTHCLQSHNDQASLSRPDPPDPAQLLEHWTILGKSNWVGFEENTVTVSVLNTHTSDYLSKEPTAASEHDFVWKHKPSQVSLTRCEKAFTFSPLLLLSSQNQQQRSHVSSGGSPLLDAYRGGQWTLIYTESFITDLRCLYVAYSTAPNDYFHYRVICLLFSQVIVSSINCQRTIFQSTIPFCPTICQKPKDFI